MINKLLHTLAPVAPYVLSFIPIFVAVNALGTMPLYLSLTEGMKENQRHKVVLNSLIVATIVAFVFMFLGNILLRLMGVTIPDFRIAGGILLLILSVHLLLPGEEKRSHVTTDVGIFPLGTPLITGPAVLTTVLVMREAYGIIPTTVSLILNMGITWLLLSKADTLIKLMGKGGARALSKVADIFLAAIAVMMIRIGLLEIISFVMSAKK
ncbi:MAG: MarC family protein [Candidatus Omnitrophota bacterium]|nr:MarC family protein [Candidatus Omnitrophota bacterium]